MITIPEQLALATKISRRITIGGAMPISIMVELGEMSDDVEFTLRMSVPHRDTGKLVPLMMTQRLPRSIDTEERMLLVFHAECARLYRHELDEQFLVDGFRIYDPHAHEEVRS